MYYFYGFFGPLGPWVGGDVNDFKFSFGIAYFMPTTRGDMYHFKFTLVMYMSCQQLGGFVLFVWCLWALWALGRGDVYHFKFSLVLYILCQQLWGICIILSLQFIVYIMITIRGVCIICLVTLGPSGPG